MSIEGRVRAIRGTTIVAGGLPTPVGSLVQVIRRQSEILDAEVIGFDGSATLLAPLGPMEGVSQGDTVRLFRTIRTVPAGEELIGRVLDATGTPLDDFGPLAPSIRVPCDAVYR
jgi:flagellar biosynthesis/type III secretory pathway ATPase